MDSIVLAYPCDGRRMRSHKPEASEGAWLMAGVATGTFCLGSRYLISKGTLMAEEEVGSGKS